MYFDHQSIGACGYGTFRQGSYVGPDTGRVAGIYNYRQMRLGFQNRNSADVQSVPGGGLVGTDPAFTENYIVVALGNDVFGGVQPFINGGGQAAF